MKKARFAVASIVLLEVGALSLIVVLAGCKASSADTCGHVFDALQNYLAECAPQSVNVFGTRDRYVVGCKLEVDAPGTSGYAAALDKCVTTIKGAKASCTLDLAQCPLPDGMLAIGKACGSDSQCVSGFCQVTATTSACGICAASVALGQPCIAGTDRCATGARCVPADGGTLCTTNDPVPIGGACDSPTASCVPGARCDFNSKTCVARGDLGAPCTFAIDCKNPLACANGTCATGKISGDSCSVDVHGQSDCVPSLVCTAASTCGAVTFVAAGELCDDQATFCQSGNCVRNSDRAYVCPTIIPDGGACDDSLATAQCDSDASCTNGACGIFDPASCK